MAGRSQAGPHSMAISEFKNNFDGGTRPNRFVVSGALGTSGDLPNHFMVKAASMPAQTLGIIPVPFRGRIAKVPGDRAYAEWTMTVLDETTHDMRRQFEEWHEKQNQPYPSQQCPHYNWEKFAWNAALAAAVKAQGMAAAELCIDEQAQHYLKEAINKLRD